MSKVDFSHAYIESNTALAWGQTAGGAGYVYLGLSENNFVVYDLETEAISNITNASTNVFNSSPKGFQVVKSGVVSTAGNCIALRRSNTILYFIKGITFSAGDTVTFQITVNFNTN